MPHSPNLIGSARAAQALGISRATFNRRVAAGEIPAVVEMDGPTGARLFDAALIDALAPSVTATDGAA